MPMPNGTTNDRVRQVANVGGRTKQEFKDDADPNRLMKQFNRTGDFSILQQSKNIALHGDFSLVPDFFSALLQVQAVTEEFMQYPSEIRSHVDNDPAQLLELLADPNRVDEAIKLGLREPTETDPLEIPLPEKPAPSEEVESPQSPE